MRSPLASIEQEVVAALEPVVGSGELSNVKPVSGGCINACYSFDFAGAQFFVKQNDPSAYPGMFAAEKKGLDLLRSTNTLKVPKAIGQGDAWLLLEYLGAGSRTADFWEAFGAGLAGMHRNTAAHFGLDHANYIGSLEQRNEEREDWVEFFHDMRIEPQLKLARDAGLAEQALVRRFDRFFSAAQDIFPQEPPALLHGDLWSGNFITGPDGAAAVVDPAVYYGSRETDLAMTRLFGGFSAAFYQAYEAEFPLEAGWRERVDLHNLYPLMVHVNLFGSSYLGQVKSALSSFGAIS